MTLAILVPLAMIRGTIKERQRYRAQAVDSIARSYAGAQAFAGRCWWCRYVERVEVEEKDDAGRDAQGAARAGRALDVLPDSRSTLVAR